MNYLDFTSRATYLAMRDVWKTDFAAQIKAVRAAKVALKNAQRAGESVYKYMNAIGAENGKVQDLLQARWQMKAEAQRQWLAEHRK